MNNQYSIYETVTTVAILITPPSEGQGGGRYV
jgi:hypothetical protein